MRPDAPEHLPRRCTPGWSRLPHTRALDHARPAVPDRHSHVLALLHAPTRAARRARRRLAWASRHAVDLDAGSPSNSHASPGAAFRAPSASTAPAEQSAAAFPMSIWPQAMPKPRPSSAVALVRPVTPCLLAVYPAASGRGACAAIEPLLMILPPLGD